MIAMNRRTKIFISKEPADMRASYDSLFSKVKDLLEEDPMSGHLFVFILSLENEASHEPGDSGDSQSVHAFG